MNRQRHEIERRIARRDRNISLVIGVLAFLFGSEGLFSAVRDFRSGDLFSGVAAASQQPYGTFLRLVCFSFLILVGLYFLPYLVHWKGLVPTPAARRATEILTANAPNERR